MLCQDVLQLFGDGYSLCDSTGRVDHNNLILVVCHSAHVVQNVLGRILSVRTPTDYQTYPNDDLVIVFHIRVLPVAIGVGQLAVSDGIQCLSIRAFNYVEDSQLAVVLFRVL